MAAIEANSLQESRGAVIWFRAQGNKIRISDHAANECGICIPYFSNINNKFYLRVANSKTLHLATAQPFGGHKKRVQNIPPANLLIGRFRWRVASLQAAAETLFQSSGRCRHNIAARSKGASRPFNRSDLAVAHA